VRNSTRRCAWLRWRGARREYPGLLGLPCAATESLPFALLFHALPCPMQAPVAMTARWHALTSVALKQQTPFCSPVGALADASRSLPAHGVSRLPWMPCSVHVRLGCVSHLWPYLTRRTPIGPKHANAHSDLDHIWPLCMQSSAHTVIAACIHQYQRMQASTRAFVSARGTAAKHWSMAVAWRDTAIRLRRIPFSTLFALFR